MKKLILIFIITVVFTGCKKSDDGTVEVIPLAPTELKGTIVSKDQVDLTWKDNSTNETGYKIERKTDSGNFTEIGALAQDITTFLDKTVSINTNYTYRVYSFNKVGKSINYSNEVNLKTINVPTLTTTAITNIISNSAKSGGNVSSDGGSAITARGVVWGTTTNPTIALSTKTSNGTGAGSFPSTVTDLVVNTKYYVKAYATNNAGTSYGNEVIIEAINSPTLTTNTISSISYRGASSGGQISSDGKAQITEKGILWGTTPSPTYELNSGKTNDGTGNGNFSSTLTSLQPGTSYYVRAYAKNGVAIGYGDEKKITTLALTVPKLTTVQISQIKSTSGISGGSIIDAGGTSIIAKGICWSISPDPTVQLSTKTINGSDIGSFTSDLTNLSLHVKYYARAYATNSTGTGYGDPISFTTKYAIGEKGPAKGFIFYDKGNSNNGWRYLEAADSDEGLTAVWWNGVWTYKDVIGITPDKSIGAGKANTLVIISANNNLNNAAKSCNDSMNNGFTDWFLPSIDELELMCKNLYSTGIATNFYPATSYWSSTDTRQIHNAWFMQFDGGCQVGTGSGRNNYNRVRPVRQF